MNLSRNLEARLVFEWLIRYKGAEMFPGAHELVIVGDDSLVPGRTPDVMAYTQREQQGCARCREICGDGSV